MSDSEDSWQNRLGSYIRCSVASEAYQAFLPPPLPPQPPINLIPLQGLLSKANQALGKLDAVADILADSNLLLYYYVRKEAVMSSLEEARKRCDETRALVESGKHPAYEKKAEKLCRMMVEGDNTFEKIARKLMEVKSGQLNAKYQEPSLVRM